MLPVLEQLRRSHRERERRGRGRLRFSAPNLDLRLERFDGAADARDESPAPYAGNDRGRVRRVFKNLQTDRRVTGDEIAIVERMDERPFDSGKRTILEGFPRDIVWHRNEFRA